MHLQTFLYDHPNDSLIMKVFDQICIKMTTFYAVNAKMHPQLIFCMVATLMEHPRIMKIHKNIPERTPNDCLKFRNDWIYGF